MTEWPDITDWRRSVATLYAEVRACDNPVVAHALWVQGRDALLREHPASPVPPAHRATYPGADIADYDPAYRFVVPVHPVAPRRLEVPVSDTSTVRFSAAGEVTLPEIGSLTVWWLEEYSGGVFLPVRDASAATYGGGRYLLDTAKGADLGGDRDALVIDLNFAYQPSCAYSPEWVCPLAGESNTVAVELPVGERFRPYAS